jgi:hypothetical protein
MATNNNILQELQELESSLGNISQASTYKVPHGYFDTLAETILLRIKTMNATSSKEEAELLAPVFKHVPEKSPYTVTADYFANNEQSLLQAVKGLSQTPEEELESLSPFLSSIKKENPYSVPDNFFDKITIPAPEQTVTETKVIAISSRKWYRYAAAAVVTSFIAVSAFLFFGKKQTIDPSEKSFAWVKKNMNKVSTDEISNFIQLTDETAPVVAVNTENTNEVKELMKNVSDKEIQEFLNDTKATEPDDLLSDNEIFN